MAANNQQSGGLAIKPMGAIAGAIAWLQQSGYQAPKDGIPSVNPANWPSALEPVRPLGPAGSEPLKIPYQLGQNLVYTPRADAQYSAAMLRALSQYPLARICIENVKDQMGRVPWVIQPKRLPGESKNEHQKRIKGDDISLKLSHFFEYPDGSSDWGTWVRQIIDDMLVIDAVSIVIRRTKGGKIGQCVYIPGDNITRYIDDNGFTPAPPYAAYAQLWEGIPRVNLSTDQLLYVPRNITIRNTYASQLYGFGPVEQLAEEIKIGAARLAYVLAYYAEGNIPNAIHIVPPEANPKQITESMKWMASELSGQLAKRRKWTFLQGYAPEGKDQVLFPPEPVLSDAFDDLHIRKLAFGLYTSAQRLQRTMNRASAEAGQNSAEEESLIPLVDWFSRAIANNIIQRRAGYVDYEMAFDPRQELDIQKNATVQTTLVGGGLRTPNEGRDAVGDDPSSDPGANELGIQTATGRVSIDVVDAQAVALANAAPPPGAKPAPKGKPAAPKKIAAGNLEKHSYGCVMARISQDSAAGKALKVMRDRIDPEHLRSHGLEEDPHVTVRYGFKGDAAPIREFLKGQGAFTIKLGQSFAFTPGEHSEGAAPICVKVESPELHQLNAAIAQHGDWKPADFDYSPHITLAYVAPITAAGYVGMDEADGIEHTVDQIAISGADE